MMNIRTSWFAMIAVAMLFLAGCSGGGDTPIPTTGRAFNGGTQGLTIEFMSNAPPPIVFDTVDSAFDLSLRLQNLGEDDVISDGTVNSEVSVSIIGIDPAQFSLTSSTASASGTLYGVKLDPQGNVLPGTISTVDFLGLHWTGPALTGSVPYQMSASLCYLYQTKSIAKLCLKPDLLSRPRDSDICEITRTINPESSGAPIRVNKLTQSAVGSNTLTFSFEIQHVGRGEVFTSESGAAVCDDSAFANEDKVRVTMGTLGSLGTVSCPTLTTNNGYVKLFDGIATVSCTVELGNNAVSGNFERALDVTVDYNYREIVSTPLMVRHIEG